MEREQSMPDQSTLSLDPGLFHSERGEVKLKLPIQSFGNLNGADIHIGNFQPLR